MCEPHIVAKTGLSVREHQERTVANYLRLRRHSELFVPVLQGWTLDDYIRCADLYQQAYVDLRREPLVAIGSVCRRQQTQGGREVIQTFSRAGIQLHAFGMKQQGLRECGWMLASSDSLAWSYAARKTAYKTGVPMIAGHTHKSCTNCLPWALVWRERLLARIAWQQPDLGLDVA